MISKRPNTVVLNLRMPLTDFASIVSAFRRVYPNQVLGISAYAKEGLCEYSKLLRDSDLAETFATPDDAQDYLITEGVRSQIRGLRAQATPRTVIPEGHAVDVSLSEPTAHRPSDAPQETGPITPDDVLRKLQGNTSNDE